MASPLEDLQKYWSPTSSGSTSDELIRRVRAIEVPPAIAVPERRTAAQRFIEDPITKGASALGLGNKEDITEDPVAREQYLQEQEASGQRVLARRKELGTDEANPAMRTWSNLASGMAGTVGSSAQFIGSETGLKWLEDFGKGAQEEAAALKPSNAGLADDVAAGFGSVLTFLVPGMGVSGAVLKSANYLLNAGKISAATAATIAKSAPYAAAALSTALESAGVSQEAFDQGMAEHGNKELARSRAWIAGMWSAPIVFVTDRLGIFGDSKGALKLLGTFMSEATQEGSQRILTNIAGYQPAGEGVAYDALIGGLAGGGIAAVQVAAEKYAERNANPDSEAKDLAIDTSRPMSPEEMFKAADVNPNIMAALSLKVNNLNEEESTILVQKMIDDGYSELAVKIARAADTDTFVDQGERIEAEIPQLYQRVDEAVEVYMRGPQQQPVQQQPVPAQQQPVDTTAAPVDQTVAPGQPTAVQPNETGQGIEVAAVPPNSPDAAIDQRTTQLTEAAFPEPAPTAEAVPTPVEQTAQPAVAEQPAQPAVAGQPAVAEQPVPEKTPTLKGEPRTPVIPQEQLLGHLLTELNRVTKGQVDETSVRIGRPDFVQTAIAKAIKWAFDTDILYVESDGIRLRDGRMFQTGSFLGKNLPGVNAIVVNLKRAEGQPSVRNTIGHELTHQLEIRHPGIYKALHAAAMQRVATGGFKGYERFLNREMAAEMERLGKTMAPEEFKAYVETELGSEITAEVVGEMWDDKGFWLQAFRMAPSATFVQQMVGTVKSLLDRLQRAFTSTGYVRGVRDINAMRTAVTTAFQQWEQTENAVATKELVEAKTGVSKAPAPLPAGVTPKAATKQRTEQAKTKAERVQKEGAEKAYGIKDEPVTETPMTRLAEGKPEPKPVNIPEKIETAPAGFQREQVLTKLYANIPVSERDLRKHPSVAKVWNALEEKKRRAKELEPEYKAFVEEIASLVGGTAKLAPIKGSGRAMQKVWLDYNGDVGRIKDILRSTIILKDPGLSFTELKALVDSRFPGAVLKRNLYAKGSKQTLSHYRDILWQVKFKGMNAEIQANTLEMFRAKEFGEGHRQYEIIRDFIHNIEHGGKPTFAEKLLFAKANLRAQRIYDRAYAAAAKSFRNAPSSISTPSSSSVPMLKGRGEGVSQAKISTKPTGAVSKDVTGTPLQSQNRVPAGNFLASVAAIAASKGKSLQPNGTGFQRAVTEDGHTVVGTTGKLVGSPGWVTTPKQLDKLRQNLKKHFDAGQPARYWYENSSKAILDVFNGDKVAAERFVALLAIYSQDATVAANTTMALNAYYQWLNGQPIHAHYGSQDVKAKALLDKGEYWSGIKTNNFYINLMAEIDPTKISDEATMDVWMKRAFGYEAEGSGFGPQQYAFMLRETQRLAKEQGWTPHQAQAAIWTGIKSESEGTQPETAGYSFADAINDRLAQISWEAQPGETVGVLPGLQTAPIEQKFEYFNAVHDVLYDKDGRDLIADKIGLPHGKQVTGYSAWKGNVGAGGQVFLPVRLEGQGAKRKVGANSAQLLNLYSALKGYILSQEAVVWHHPIYDPAKKNANGIDLTFACALSADEMRQLYQAVHDRFDTWDLAPGYTPSGARILNFTDISNVDFQAGMHDVLSTLPNGFGGSTGEVNAQAYRSDGDYISNDWEQFPDGAGYVQRFETGTQDGAAQRSDLQAWADELRARVETVNRTFSDRYGWGEWRQPQTRGQAGQAGQAGGFSRAQGIPNGQSPESPIGDVAVLRLQKQLKKNLGKCHALSGRMVAFDPEDRFTLVLSVVNGAPYAPIKIWHSMVKDPVTGNVYDPIIERWTTPELAAKAIGFEPIVETTAPEVRKLIAKNKYWVDQNTLKPRGWELTFLEKGDYDANPEIFAKPNDNAAQLAYMQQRAKEAGATSVDEWGKNNPLDFVKAASEWRTEHPSQFQRQYDPIREGEDLKSYMKRAIDTGPVIESLPQDPGLYFVIGPDTQILPIDKLDLSKPQENEKGGINAPKRFVAAADGAIPKRAPIDVEPRGDRYLVIDGNGTVAALKRFGWDSVPANIKTGFQRQTETAEFKAWFGDSKVVDEKGKPLVVYHGTVNDIQTFDAVGKRGLGAYFSADTGYANAFTARAGSASGGNVLPVYLSIQKPASDADLGAAIDSGAASSTEIRAFLEQRGFDGLIHRDEMVAFRPEQIKSAIGNRGTFNPNDARISFQRTQAIPVAKRNYEDIPYLNRRAMADGYADVQEWRTAKPESFRRAVKEAAEAPAQMPLFQRQQPIAGAKYNLPGETRTDVVQKLFQDREARVANVQQAVTSQGGKVEEASNVYRTIERFYGGSAFKLDQFKKKTVEPLLERIGAAGVELNDIAMYMYAMHAKERNDWIASINPLMPDGGSGMKNAEAAKVLASFRTDPQFADIQQFANELWAISKNTQQVMLNSGMVTPGVVAGWNSRSQHYVPLQGFENLDELGQRGAGTGVGFDVRGPEARRAKGRETKAGQIVENIIFNHEKAIIRAEKNKVGKALLNFVLQNPDPVLWQVDKLQSMPQFYKSGTVNIHGLLDGEVRYLNQVVQNPDQTIVVKHYGKEYAIWVKDKAMLEAMKGDGGLMSHGEEAAKGYFRAWQAVNRTLSKAWTAWNPVFTTINFTRDLVTGMIHSANIGGTKNAAKIAADLFPMMKGIWDVERNNNENTANAKWYMQYQEDGGKTGFYVFGDMEERIRNINVLVANARKGVGVKQSAAAALKAMHAIESTVMDYNAIVENAIRVSAYKNAIEQQGMSRAEASSFAKNLTVNFNRKGQLTKNLSSLYLFFNPSVQGVARMVQAAKNNKREFAVAVGSMVAMGIMFGLMGADDKDEEGMPYWDRIPAYEKQRSLILMTGDGNRVTVPLPYGYGYFVSFGYGIADLMRGRPTGSVAMDQVNSMTQHFSPIGGGDDPMVALMPTIATPFVEQWANKRVTGQPVMPDAEKINGMPIPDSERYWGSTRGTAVQQFTEWLNEATGGTKISPGAVSVSPESVKNFVRFGTGGAGTFLTDAFESVYVSQEIDFEAAREKNLVPFLRQWYRYDNVRDDVAYYAEAKKQALTALEEFKKYQDTDRPEVLERLQRNRSVALLGSSIQGMERALRNLRLQEIAIMENKALSTEEQYRARQQLDDQKEQLLMQWNAKFYGAELESRQ